tara:strand:+ start:4059 stop:5420 length:1362 start_codon:yes stop_codon:yes gene_type:complete
MENKKVTVAYFAVGSAIKFDKKKLLRSDGTSEYFSTIRLLLKNPNVERVLLLSKSDWKRISHSQRKEIDPEGKIFDPYTVFPELHNRPKPNTLEERRQYYMRYYEILKESGIKADYGIGFTSQGWSTTALPGYLNTLKPPFKPVKCLDMTLFYASEVIYYLNMTNLKWWLLATDPRYVKPSMRYRDITNLPQKVLGQQDFDISWFGVSELKRDAALENEGDYITRNIVSRYSGIEKMNLIDGGVVNPETVDKPHKFTIVSMQLSPPTAKEDLRFNILKEYVLDRDPEQKARIYGKWSDFFKADNPQLKGYIATEDLDKTFGETRYTLVLPTAAGWVTSKYAEMLQLGVVPFLHPDYDTQYHIVPKEHPLRVTSADDFYKKMEYFDANPDKRIKFVQHLQELLISDAYTGKFMLDLINKNLEEVGIDKKLLAEGDALYPKKEKQIEVKVKPTLF